MNHGSIALHHWRRSGPPGGGSRQQSESVADELEHPETDDEQHTEADHDND
jgi:hypothetical protein